MDGSDFGLVWALVGLALMELATSERDFYDPQFFAKIAAVENEHFWFAARNRIIKAAIETVIRDLPRGYRLLEVGCGTGVVLRQLVDVCHGGEVMGMDLFPEAVAFATARAGCPVIVGDILNPPALGQFDIVTIFDVLEHLPNDDQIVAGLNRVLKPGGRWFSLFLPICRFGAISISLPAIGGVTRPKLCLGYFPKPGSK